jgi:hypothetical protein
MINAMKTFRVSIRVSTVLESSTFYNFSPHDSSGESIDLTEEYMLEEILDKLGCTEEEWEAMNPAKQKQQLDRFARRWAFKRVEFSIQEVKE